MKHNKENIIKVLEAVRGLNHRLAEYYAKEGDKKSAERYISEALAISEAIFIINNKDLFNKYVKNMHIEEEA